MSPEQARGKVGGQTHRHLGVRLRAVRDALGKDGVRGRHGHRHDRRDSRAGSRLVDPASRHTSSRSSADAALPRKGCPKAAAGHRDARVEIEQIIRLPSEDIDADIAVHQSRTWRRRARLAIAGGAVAALSATALAVLALSRDTAPAPDSRVVRMTVDLPENQRIGREFNSKVALSPDGTHLAFTPLPGPVYIRRLDGLERPAARDHKVDRLPWCPALLARRRFDFFHREAIRSLGGRAPSSRPPCGRVPRRGSSSTSSSYRGDGAQTVDLLDLLYPGGIVRIRDSGGPIEPVTELDAKKGRAQPSLRGPAAGRTGPHLHGRIRRHQQLQRRSHRAVGPEHAAEEDINRGGTSAVYLPPGTSSMPGKELYAAPFDLQRQEVTGVRSSTRRRDDEREHRGRALQPVGPRRPGLRSRRGGWREPDAGVGRSIREGRPASAAASLVPVSANLPRRPVAGRGDRGTHTTSTSTILPARFSAR